MTSHHLYIRIINSNHEKRFTSGLAPGKDYRKSGTFSGFACCENDSVMIFNDLFTKCKPDPGAAVRLLPVKPLKNIKDLFAILRLKANPVV